MKVDENEDISLNFSEKAEGLLPEETAMNFLDEIFTIKFNFTSQNEFRLILTNNENNLK